jgi:outer membrane protein TolC
LNSYLKLPSQTSIELVFDYDVPTVILNENKILERAITNNPEMIAYKLEVLYAESLLEKAKREKGFAFDLVAGYGLSKIDGGYDALSSSYKDGEIGAMFSSPYNRYSQATIGINMPIIDWGRRRGTYKIRKAEYEISESEYEQDLVNFKQQILIMVRQFNLLPKNIEAAAISANAAQESYEIYDKYFKKGETELINLISSINQRDNARREYLNSLYDYWNSYYKMRIYTLYDFIEKKDLEVDFDKLIGN